MRHPSTSRYAVLATTAAAVAALATMAGCSTAKPTTTTNAGGTPAAVQTLGSAAAQESTSPVQKPTVHATLASNGGGLKPVSNPWTDKVYHPGLINSVNAAGMEGTVGIQPAQFNVPSGTDTFVLVPLSQQDPTAYTLAPGAKLYVSATWSNLPRPTDHTDFAPVTYSQFVTYARAQGASAKPDSVEVWYALNSKRQITLLFQVYHP